MSLTPMLSDWELPRVTRLETLETRDFLELPVPGRAGSLFQDLDRRPARILIEGSVFGSEAGLEMLNAVREKYLAGEPMTFVSDIVTGTDIQYVLMQQLHIQAEASAPDQIDYTLWLTESPPPPPPTDVLGGIDIDLVGCVREDNRTDVPAFHDDAGMVEVAALELDEFCGFWGAVVAAGSLTLSSRTLSRPCESMISRV